MISMFLCGYFSEAVINIINVKSKIASQTYIEEILKEEILVEEVDLFYKTVTEDGVIASSFDVNKANLLLSKTMSKMRKISKEFEENEFVVMVPASYLFIPSAYFLPNLKLNVATSTLLYYDVSLKTDIREYGINSSLVSLILKVDIKYQVIVPLMVQMVDNSIEIPLSLEIINGEVPQVLLSYLG